MAAVKFLRDFKLGFCRLIVVRENSLIREAEFYTAGHSGHFRVHFYAYIRME